MKKRGFHIINVISMVLIVIATVHTAAHGAFFGTGVSGLGEKGISGWVIENKSVEDLRTTINQNSPKTNSFSRILILFEWGLLIALLTGNMALEKARKVHEKNQVLEIKKQPRGKSKTDLDVLYEILKEKKKVEVSAIAKAFNINPDIALEWAKILEASNLASLNYTRLGEAELTIVET